MVYNFFEFCWLLVILLSKDGLEYIILNLVYGEIMLMCYGGNYKLFGFQYVWGIQEGNGIFFDGDLWVIYSMNKEDMWVFYIFVFVCVYVSEYVDDDFVGYKDLSELIDWNLYFLQWVFVLLDGKWLVL